MWDFLSIMFWAYQRYRKPCPGPLEKYLVPMAITQDEESGAEYLHLGSILRCKNCSYMVTSGNCHDERHIGTPIVEVDEGKRE